jgi:hypothetical protein
VLRGKVEISAVSALCYGKVNVITRAAGVVIIASVKTVHGVLIANK